MALTPFTLKAPSQEDATPDARNAPFEGHPFLPQPGTFWHTHGRVAIAATPKTASSGIRKALGLHYIVSINADKVHLYDRAIAFIRDPMQRIESCWHYFHARGGFPAGYDKYSKIKRSMNFEAYEQFVDYVLNEPGYLDKHWMPQDYNLQGHPTEYYLLEDAAEVLLSIGLNLEPNVNSSGVALSGNDYRAPELEAFYAADIELRKQCITLKSTPAEDSS
jgi:hypothetical protein